MAKPVNLALIGAGNRGAGIFGNYALQMPHQARFTAVVEPDAARRQAFATAHSLRPENCFAAIPDFFALPPAGIDGVVVATLENLRLEPVLQAMAQGWHILVEKPLCTTPEDLIRLHDATASYPQCLIVCHQMRLTPVYRTIKELITGGDCGEIVCIQHSENLSWHHMAHGFVRGLFRNDRLTPMLLAKSCHDLDLLAHLVGRPAARVASFGGLKHFRSENAPPGAPKFCLQGCPHAETCPYHVMKIYFEPDTDADSGLAGGAPAGICRRGGQAHRRRG